ncbi:general transcription factor II-I repeat domain-containing protein 2-like [Oopsacas minuta]|uniref:General transcription factor II-I repeat domain-containing protein 2-like n=1 Tax=Oopsacas minuta TaxID=111878 RepID=A0AAV7JSS4_9METZ|nr:general transcription factor II-I repeat domain-containing protein 2-like [Oopsacas minuta]
MTRKVEGTVSLMEKEMRNAGIERKLVKIHCIIHLEALCAKSLKIQVVMRVVIKIVSFMRARGLYHRQFQHMLDEMDNQYGDLLYYCEVRWLSRGTMLQRVYQLRAELTNLLREKGMEVPELIHAKWVTDFACLVDIANHPNMLNLKIQGMNQSINVLYEQIYAFEVKLQLWELQLNESNCIHFPTLRSHQTCDILLRRIHI